MIKSNLPVIILKDLTLLPYQEVRVELKSEITKKVIKISKQYHDSEVMIVCPLESFEENVEASDLPKIGVVGKINTAIELPNGNVRVTILGLYRAKILSYVNYSNEDDILESIIIGFEKNNESEIEEISYFRKLIEEIEIYINKNPFVTNSIMSQIKGTTSLDKITDIIANFLPLSTEKKINLMLDASSISRSKTLIKEIAVESAVIELENKIEEEVKKGLDDSQKEFLLKEKIKIINKELGVANIKDEEITSIKERILKGKFPDRIKYKLNKELKNYSNSNENSPELLNIRNYIEYLLMVPWFTETKDEKDLNKIEKKLSNSHYGMEEVKTRILEYIALKTISPNINSPIICLVGPPGVGKTTFAESISKALGRKYIKLSLGGMSDSADLIGHRRTYLGSFPGKIITSLIKCETKNPVILLDEVDKLKKDYKSDPASTLLDILDSTQNKRFVDNYIDEEVDLSKVLFILTANNINDIPNTLLDRLEIININGYTEDEKLIIANKHIIPNILNKCNIKSSLLKIEDKAILKIITDYTKESGVRDLERNINKIIRKIITNNLKNNKKNINIKIKEEDIKTYLKTEIYPKTNEQKKEYPSVVNVVASSNSGAVVLKAQCTSYKGNGLITLTGSLGNITKESVSVAISYIKSKSKEFKINEDFFNNKDIHIHFTESNLPKDGPSAGISIVTLLLSHIKNKVIKKDISMTGEITLTGEILRVGSVKEKIIACTTNDINTLYLPSGNKNDIEFIEENIKNKINIVLVDDYQDIYNKLFK